MDNNLKYADSDDTLRHDFSFEFRDFNSTVLIASKQLFSFYKKNKADEIIFVMFNEMLNVLSFHVRDIYVCYSILVLLFLSSKSTRFSVYDTSAYCWWQNPYMLVYNRFLHS